MGDEGKVVVVTGDVTMDWNLARTKRAESGGSVWFAGDRTRACWQPGGAALLADLITAVTGSLRQSGRADYQVHQMAAPKQPVHPGDEQYHHAYATWSLHMYGKRTAAEKDRRAWRVEEFLGLDRNAAEGPSATANWKKVRHDPLAADLVVLDDADLGFRDHAELWPKAITTKGSCAWILLKMARPVAQGRLWEHLHQHCAERLIVVMTVNDLRLTEVQVSRELSWERTAQDLAWELVHNPRVNALSHCAHVVISFDTAGAVLLSQPQAGGQTADRRIAPQCRLFFDPQGIEGMWEQNYPGGMIGYTSCLTAGIARQLLLSPDQPNIDQGMQSGLAAMRTLHLEGYGARETTGPDARLAFPSTMIAAELAREGAPFAVAEVQNPLRFLSQPAAEAERAPAAGCWSILQDRYTNTLGQVAQQIVLEGPEVALQGVPLGQFGRLLTVDRQEIESFRSMQALIGEYCRKQQVERPLSIAVFGAPGSGKSFGISEVAHTLRPGQIAKQTFNLSQFNAPEALLGAFHQVRDVVLSGCIPLVFWDEFDTSLNGKPLGWLRHFLVPMQDGSFQEGQLTHPIGRCIFVFAGGTSASMEAFDKGSDDEGFCEAKGPDFVSRLKGFINILGPNQQTPARAAQAAVDPYHVIRRAILLRSILHRDAPQLFQRQDDREVLNIDAGVLRAFLEIRTYKHGVRSMESLIAMSRLTGKNRFERSCLPAEAQLDLHVHARAFLALVQQIALEGTLCERLAEAAHKVFCEGLHAKGYRWGPHTDDACKTHSSLKSYAELPEDEKQQNRGNVQDIPTKLARVGYVMMPARSNEPPFDFPGSDLELLAEMEHERWMQAKIATGWRWAAKTDRAQKLHADILLWRTLSDEEQVRLYTPAERAAIGPGELPEEEKDKDRSLVQGIPQILAKVGYTIVQLSQGTSQA
jgi:hypothetical protein